MEPGTFEDDEDRRTERTVIGAELTGRVNGLRLLIMRGRGCAHCEKGCDRKRRDGRTAHPNCPFNPLLASLADMFHLAVVRKRAEVRVNAVVHLKTVVLKKRRFLLSGLQWVIPLASFLRINTTRFGLSRSL
jgi:hypothetical protein